jgi:biopolymer transport protein ExbB
MSARFPLLEFADNAIVWAILVLALCCFVLEFRLLLELRSRRWHQQLGMWLSVLPVLLGALPLLGLLGTIAGLLTTFRSMAQSGSLDQQSLLGSGIADALITTQLGLLMAIPGLLLLAVLRRCHRAWSET